MASKICVVGSGAWGSVVAKVVGDNVRNNAKFESRIPMYVFEEMINGEKLTEIINTRHENVKYQPGLILPDNVVAVSDVVESVKDADYLFFVLPHQFIRGVCRSIAGKIKPDALAISLCKGLDESNQGIDLLSNAIRNMLNIECAVVMGANIASEVGNQEFCETTIGCKDKVRAAVIKEMLQTDYLRVSIVPDEITVELCGALKNIVATGAGFTDGLGLGNNTKAAVIRLGMMEMIKFCKLFDSDSQSSTFMESCGIADVITTCFSGRNARCAKEFVISGKSIEEVERDMLNGQKLQGPPTAAEVHIELKKRELIDEFPLFTAVHRICTKECPPSSFIACLKNHPEHSKI